MGARETRQGENLQRLIFISIGSKLWGLALAVLLAGCGAGDRSARELGPGITYHKVHLLEGPWWIHVVEVDLPRAWQAGVRLRTVSAPSDKGGVERTSTLAKGALAAVNGDFFYTSETSHTAGLQVSAGALLQAPQRRSAFAVTASGKPLVAAFQMEIGIKTALGRVLPVQKFNRTPREGELALYNYHAQSWQDSVHAALGFQLQSLRGHSIINDTLSMRVLQLRRRAWPLVLEPDQWLLAAGSTYAGDAIAPGDTVQLFCNLLPARERLLEALGGGPRILRDGDISIEYEEERLSRSFAEERHPRTAVGYSQNGEVLFLVVVDGRQPGYSVGMTLAELAGFMRMRLADFSSTHENAYQALNLDGGGSTTMVVEDEVVNSPSDQTGERPVANVLLVSGP
jgi:hypothetical protein